MIEFIKKIFNIKKNIELDLIDELIKDWYNNFYKYWHRYNNYKIIKQLNIDYKKITYLTRNTTRQLNIAKKLELENYTMKTSEILEKLEKEIRKSTIN